MGITGAIAVTDFKGPRLFLSHKSKEGEGNLLYSLGAKSNWQGAIEP